MPTTVDNKVVEMRFDNKQFESGINQSIGSLTKLKQTLNFDGAIDNNRLNSIASAVDYLASRFTALGQVFNNVKMQAMAMVKSLTIDQIGEGWNKYNTIIQSTQTIMSATAKNWTDNKNDLKDQNKQMEFVTIQLDKLNRFTDETSAKLTDMTSNIGKFTSAGVKLDTATDAMMGIATWGYKSGASIDQMSRAMYNLSQAMGMGSLRVQDWMSIENANMATEEFKDTCIKTGLELGVLKKNSKGAIYALDRYGKQVVVTTENFRSTLASGWLNSEVITATLKKYGDFASEILAITEELDVGVTPMMRDIQAVKDGTLDLTNAAQMMKRAKELEIDDVAAYTTALEKLSAAQYDLGFSAFRASQEAKTFQEAIDYTKDAVSTGWMNTFKTIVGDYLEAKDLWTAVTEEMYDVFIFDLEQQNSVLKKWGEGGGREALLEGIANAWHNIKTLIEAIKGEFKAIFPPATADTLLAITDGFRAFTYTLKFTEDQTEKLNRLFSRFFIGIEYIVDGFKNLWDVFAESIRDNNLLPKDFFDENGIFNALRELTVEFTDLMYTFHLTREGAEKFRPLFDSIFKLITTVGSSIKTVFLAASKAIKKVFGGSELGLIEGFARIINNVSDALSINGKRTEQLQTIFEGFLSVVDIIKMLLEGILGPIFGLTDGVSGLTDGIFTVGEVIAKVIIWIRDWLKEHDSWKKAIQWVVDFIKKIPEYANNAAQALFGMDLKTLFEKVKEAAQGAWEAVKNFFSSIFGSKDTIDEGVTQPVQELGEQIEETGKTFTVFDKLREWVEKAKQAFEQAKPYIEEVFNMFKENVHLELPSMEELGDAAVKGGTAGVLFMVIKYFAEIIKLFKNGSKISKSIEGVFNTISKSIKTLTGALKDRIKADIFKVIATGVLEIAAAMFVLALLPEDKLMASTFAVGAMMAELAFAFGLISRTNTSKDKLTQIKGMLTVLETILATLVAGVFLIATKTDIDSAVIAASMIGALMAEVALFMKIMETTKFTKAQAEKLEKMFQSLAVLMVAIGAAIALATSTGDWSSIAAAGTVMSGMLFAMAGALRIMPKSKNIKELSEALTILSVALVLIGASLAIAASGGDWTAIAAAGTLMAAMLVAMAGALKMLSGTEDLMKSALALTVLSGGILLLGMALAAIGNLNIEQIAVAVLAMSAALIILLAAGAVAEKVAIGLVALGAAITLIGVGVLAAGAGIMLFAEGMEKLVGLGSEGATIFIDSLTAFFANLPMYASNAGDAVIAFIEKIAGAKETLINGFTTVLGALIQALINIAPKILELITVLIKGVFQMLTELTPDLFAFLDVLFEELDTFFWKWVPRITQTIIMFTKQLLLSLREIVPDLTETLFFILKDTLRQIRDNIEEIISLSVEIGILTITGFLKGLASQIPNIVETGIDFVLALLNGIADGIESRAEDIRNTMINLVQSLTNAFCTLLGINSPSTVFEGFGDNIIQGLINGIGSMIESAKKKICELADKVLTAVCDFFGIDKPQSAQELFQLGKNIIYQFNNAIYGMIEKAKKMICELADRVLTAICNFFGVDKPKTAQEFYKLGLNLINSLIDSIKGMVNKVKNAVGEVANGAINKFKSVLGIHSPSKVFAEFGRYIDLGLAMGLDKFSYLASDASESVGDKAIDAMSAVISGLSDMVEEGFSDPTIKPVIDLTDVEDGLNAMDDMLASDKSMMLSSYASTDFNANKARQNASESALSDLRDLLNGNGSVGTTNNNVFNITGDNPKEIAEEVSRILQKDVERRNAAWA